MANDYHISDKRSSLFIRLSILAAMILIIISPFEFSDKIPFLIVGSILVVYSLISRTSYLKINKEKLEWNDISDNCIFLSSVRKFVLESSCTGLHLIVKFNSKKGKIKEEKICLGHFMWELNPYKLKRVLEEYAKVEVKTTFPLWFYWI